MRPLSRLGRFNYAGDRQSKSDSRSHTTQHGVYRAGRKHFLWGKPMKMFSECSDPCETCKVHLSGCMCLAGHGDDDYVHADAAWIAAQTQAEGSD